MPHSNNYNLIIESINQIDSLKLEKDEGSSIYRGWMENTESIIREIFNADSVEYKELHKLFHPVYASLPSGFQENIDYHKQYLHHLENIKHKLAGYSTIVKMRLQQETEKNPNDSILKVSSLCAHFNKVVRSIRKRYADRPPLEIEDEYDVQYLLKILLSASFDDVRQEETTPSYAGAYSRIDFLLKNEKIAIETKMTRSGLTDKELGKQLILDASYYETHPTVSTLICFIYDPQNYISNPEGLIQDLEKRSNNNLLVKVFVNPL